MAEPDKADATVPRTNFVDGFLRSPFSGTPPKRHHHSESCWIGCPAS
jgi:hypothetical protein